MSSGLGRKILAAGPALAPLSVAEHKERDFYMSEASIDSDLVVILAALLCALICALGLNSLMRCALRCSRRMAFESSDDVAVRLANTGLKKAAMRALPIVVYSTSSEGAGVGSDCPICLAEFVDGEKVRVLPKCNHAFHVECIDMWLVSHSSCPTCRHCLKRKPSSAPVKGHVQPGVQNSAVHVTIDMATPVTASSQSSEISPDEVAPAITTSPPAGQRVSQVSSTG